jgi:prepilin-type N-terminal cleavage/methylation domain-containing protein/prepilin-type processing-associated H-X9-DG protein
MQRAISKMPQDSRTGALPIRSAITPRRGGCPESRAFTLIEVLVVVAILALLVAVLLPSLAAARQQSRRLLCATNLHTWGSAAQMYAHSHQGYIPRDYGYTQGVYVASGGTWHVCPPEVLSPLLGGPKLPLVPPSQDPFMLKHPDVLKQNPDCIRDEYLAAAFQRIPALQCPSFPAVEKPVLLVTGEVIREQPYDYAINGFPIAEPVAGGEGGGLTRLERIRLPAKLVYVTEVNRLNAVNFFGYHDLFADNHLWDGAVPRMINDNRHPGSGSRSALTGSGGGVIGFANALMFDGHVETLRIDQITRRWFTIY